MATVTDSATGIKTTYYYDFTDRLAKYTETGANYSHSVDYTFDEKNNLTSHAETINGTTRTASFVYDDDNRIESMTADGTTVVYTRDAYGRLSQKVTKQGEATVKTETFTYTPNAAATSGQVASHTICYGTYTFAYTYTYDDNGNIASLSETISSTTSSAQITRSNTYTYDTAGQLLRENNGFGFGTNAWNYDNAGNIVCKGVPTGTGTEVNPSTACEYTYGDSDWGDLLTAYNGTTIDYDDIGNPLTYGSRTYTWEHGRQLKSLAENGTTWTYTYNSGGLRTGRTNGTTTYTYIYDGSQLSRMTVDGHTLDFTYDASGIPLTVKLDGTVYYYATNLQGDVIGIFDSTGNQKAMYSYDAWGVIGTMPTQSAISIYNPLRYRGYVYDPETELYYLQSRYYDPEIGRFLNADGLVSTDQGLVSNNMLTYCLNNPVIYEDVNGLEPSYTLDTNGDGIEDCYVYEYQHTSCYHIRNRTYRVKVTGKVYIYTGYSSEQFLSLNTPSGFSSSTDLMVLDMTHNTDNPNMLARQAQRTSANYHSEIIACMKQYDKDFSTPWKRTSKSLKTEWDSHNFFAPFSTTAQNVDFDNKEEGKKFWYFVQKGGDRFWANIKSLFS